MRGEAKRVRSKAVGADGRSPVRVRAQDPTATLAGRIREAAKAMSGEFDATALAETLGVQTYRDRKNISNRLHDLFRSGEVERVGLGEYRYVGKTKPQTKEYFLWRRLRKGAVSVKDLMVFAGSSRKYVLEWLKHLKDQGLVVELAGEVHQLVKDPVEMPKNNEKAQRLRELRASQRAKAMADLNDALILIERAKGVVAELMEE